MTILNFVTQEELDNLSEDSRVAFMELVNHAQRRLSEQVSRFDPENQREWSEKSDIEKSFMNVIVAAGKNFGVEPFATMEIPRHQDFRNSDYQQFKSDLDHFITQLILDNSFRARGNSVGIHPESKDKIRSYVRALRDCIGNASMQPAERRVLLRKLDEFEQELDKPRTSFVSLAMIAMAVLGVPGATWASFDVTQKLVTNITHVFAEAKQQEEASRRIAPAAAPRAISPPRSSDEGPLRRSNKDDNLDGEIPF